MGPEGGKEALWVTPAGQALLIDTGSPGGRDTDRIMEAITAAGVTTLDFLLSTHNHVDRVGGLQELVKRIPVAHFYDHGATIEDGLSTFVICGFRLQAEVLHRRPGDQELFFSRGIS